jgi:hypothetical protein
MNDKGEKLKKILFVFGNVDQKNQPARLSTLNKMKNLIRVA